MYKYCLYTFLTFIFFISCSTNKKYPTSKAEELSYEQSDGRLKVMMNGVEIWGHQYEVMDPPAGVNPAFARSGFNHPVKTPSGKLLTWIQAPDHYHHYGIWNPWTHVQYDGDTLDFWNLNGKQGTVKWEAFTSIRKQKNSLSYEAVHDHVRLRKSEETALVEKQGILIEPISKDEYLVNFDSYYECGTDKAFKILEYRYAGFGWRCTQEWNKDNSMVLTSKNIERKGADGTRAKWILVQGTLGDGYGGILMMSDPSNYNHVPNEGEPIRIWPENSNGRGDMFANFSPTKNMDWLLEPGKKYHLGYKLLVFDGKYDFDMAEAAYNKYLATNK